VDRGHLSTTEDPEGEQSDGVEQRALRFRLPAPGFYRALFFAYVGTVLLLFTFFVPPFQKSDEVAHFWRAVTLSNFDVACDTDENGNQYFTMERRYAEIETDFHIWEVAMNYNRKFDWNWLRTSFTDPSYREAVRVYSLYCNYPPVGHPITAAGVMLGKPFANPLVSFYGGRVAGALFFLGALVYALKVTPAPYRPLVYFYGALPSVLHQVSAVSYDATFLALLLPVFAFTTSALASQKSLKPLHVAIFLAALVWMVNVRMAAYLPLLLLFFVIKPGQVTTDRRRYLLIAGAFIGAALLLMAWQITQYYPEGAGVSEEAQVYSVTEQLRYVAEAPWRMIEVTYRTLDSEGEGLIHQSIAGFGWQDYTFGYFTHYLFVFASAALLAVTVVRERPLLDRLQLLILGAAVLGTAAGILVSAYMSFTPVGSDLIWGLQGRYFVVLLPLAFLAIAQLRVLVGWERLLQALLVTGVLIVIWNVYRAIDLRYFE
jgi:uncharacterized membrane protein